jgi:anti-anti-sigma regulatory factor
MIYTYPDRYISRVTMTAERRYVVTASGTLDASTAADLERMAEPGLGPDTDVLVLDLAGVAHCDGMAVQTLLAIASRGTSLRLIASMPVRDALALAGVGHQFTMWP